MTVRRAAHAGVSPGVGLLFPVVNHVVMLLFAALPPVGSAPLRWPPAAPPASVSGVLAGALIVVAAVLFSVTAFGAATAPYCFWVSPFVVRFVPVGFNRAPRAPPASTAGWPCSHDRGSGALVSLASKERCA